MNPEKIIQVIEAERISFAVSMCESPPAGTHLQYLQGYMAGLTRVRELVTNIRDEEDGKPRQPGPSNSNPYTV